MSQLVRQVARALDLAIRLDRLDVADHLVGALETLCPDPLLGSPLATAYLAIADSEAQGLSRSRHKTTGYTIERPESIRRQGSMR